MPNSHISTRNLCLKCQYFRYPAYFTSALECLLDISNLKCQSWVPALPTTNLLICSLSHFHDGSSIFLIFYIQNLGDTLDLSLPPSSQLTSNFLFLLSAEGSDHVPQLQKANQRIPLSLRVQASLLTGISGLMWGLDSSSWPSYLLLFPFLTSSPSHEAVSHLTHSTDISKHLVCVCHILGVGSEYWTRNVWFLSS